MSDLQQELQQLVAIHGIGKVYAGLYGKMKEDYEFLREFFSAETPIAKPASQPKKKVVAAAKVAEPDTTDTTDMSASALRDAKIRIVKKEVAQQDPLELFPPAEVPVVAPTVPTAAPVKPPTFKTPKEAKEWQKEQELKKKQELLDAGTAPNSLLTKENLEQWIVKDSRTYAFIAREYVGLPEAMVSESAKAFGIQSETSKKRNEMIKKKKVQQKGSS